MQRKCHKHQCQRRRTSSDSLQGKFDRKPFVSSHNHISIPSLSFKLLLSILLCCQVHLGGEESEAVRLIQSSSEQPSSLSSATVSIVQRESKEVKEAEQRTVVGACDASVAVGVASQRLLCGAHPTARKTSRGDELGFQQ